MVACHVGETAERALENQSASAVLGQVDGDRSAEGTSEQDDLPFVDPGKSCKLGTRRPSVSQYSLFARLAFALAIASVIKDQDARARDIAKLADRMDSMPVEGGTNLEQALALGLEKAREQKLEGGQNRIILLTDGAANLGNADPKDLARLVGKMREERVAFDACGVGADGLNDEILEALTRKGDGRYYLLDRPEDADEGFAKQIAGALRPAARNVKVQVNFNPERVGRYKLYGFAKHLLQEEDFRNDSVDAAELAAEEAGNAIYQVEVLPEGRGDLGTVSVRFQDPESSRMIEREWTIPYDPGAPTLADAPASIRLASSAALLAERLAGSPIGETVELNQLGTLINGLASELPSSKRVGDLLEMSNQVREQLGE